MIRTQHRNLLSQQQQLLQMQQLQLQQQPFPLPVFPPAPGHLPDFQPLLCVAWLVRASHVSLLSSPLRFDTLLLDIQGQLGLLRRSYNEDRHRLREHFQAQALELHQAHVAVAFRPSLSPVSFPLANLNSGFSSPLGFGGAGLVHSPLPPSRGNLYHHLHVVFSRLPLLSSLSFLSLS